MASLTVLGSLPCVEQISNLIKGMVGVLVTVSVNMARTASVM